MTIPQQRNPAALFDEARESVESARQQIERTLERIDEVARRMAELAGILATLEVSAWKDLVEAALLSTPAGRRELEHAHKSLFALHDVLDQAETAWQRSRHP